MGDKGGTIWEKSGIGAWRAETRNLPGRSRGPDGSGAEGQAIIFGDFTGQGNSTVINGAVEERVHTSANSEWFDNMKEGQTKDEFLGSTSSPNTRETKNPPGRSRGPDGSGVKGQDKISIMNGIKVVNTTVGFHTPELQWGCQFHSGWLCLKNSESVPTLGKHGDSDPSLFKGGDYASSLHSYHLVCEAYGEDEASDEDDAIENAPRIPDIENTFLPAGANRTPHQNHAENPTVGNLCVYYANFGARRLRDIELIDAQLKRNPAQVLIICGTDVDTERMLMLPPRTTPDFGALGNAAVAALFERPEYEWFTVRRSDEHGNSGCIAVRRDSSRPPHLTIRLHSVKYDGQKKHTSAELQNATPECYARQLIFQRR